MNKRGQVGAIFVMLAFWLVYIFFLSPFLNAIVTHAIANGEITGLLAFVLSNLNILIGFASLAVLFWAVRGGG